MRLLVSSTLVMLLATVAGAQEGVALVACATSACGLLVDWGPGKTAGTYGADRRYGSGDDFESGVRRGLSAHGITTQAATGAAFTITVRPKVNTRAMCDEMAGTGTNFGCAVVSDVAVNFTSADAALKAPGALRLTNRCGGEKSLTMVQFGQYVGEMVWWSITPPEAKEKKPAMRC